MAEWQPRAKANPRSTLARVLLGFAFSCWLLTSHLEQSSPATALPIRRIAPLAPKGNRHGSPRD